MTINDIKNMKNQQPFWPFTLYMLDRRELRVTHPEAISWDDADPKTAIVARPDGGCDLIDVASIVSIGVKERRTTPSSES